MTFSFYKKREIQVGDLVSHYLYSSKWIGLVLKLELLGGDAEKKERYDKERAFVRMVPGTKHQDYFIKASKAGMRQGWVYCKWLWVLGEERLNDFKKNKADIL